MSWEAITAIGSVGTGVVIFLTVIFARRQVELTRQQLHQLRQATQLEGAIAIYAELESPRVEAARMFVLLELPAKMKDPTFRDEVRLVAQVDETQHQELIILRTYDRIGIYIDAGLIDGDVIYRGAMGRILTMWEALADVVAIHRQTAAFLWSGFEGLASGARAFAVAQHADLAKVGQLMAESRARAETAGLHERPDAGPATR
jgi:hypothetical protein